MYFLSGFRATKFWQILSHTKKKISSFALFLALRRTIRRPRALTLYKQMSQVVNNTKLHHDVCVQS